MLKEVEDRDRDAKGVENNEYNQEDEESSEHGNPIRRRNITITYEMFKDEIMRFVNPNQD